MTKIRTNHIPPANSDVENDRELVARLVANNEEAWAFVVHEIILPLIRADIRGIGSRCRRAGLPMEAVANRLYENLARDGFAPLRAFRFECALKSWLFWHVRDAAQRAIRETLGKGTDISADGIDPDTFADVCDPLETIENQEELERANRLVTRLWNTKPIHAMVLLLREDLGLSSKETGAILGKSPANVDQINHRAQSFLRTLRDDENDAIRPLGPN